MDDQNRLRLDRIAARHARRTTPAQNGTDLETQAETATDAPFLEAFARARDDVLRPVMAEVGLQLKSAGYGFRISPGGEEGSPSVDLHILIPERGDSKDTIRFFAQKDAERGWQVIAELELKRTPFELTRFESTLEITRDVAEQLIVQAIEQMFASTGEAPRSETPSAPPPAPPGGANPGEALPTIAAIAAPAAPSTPPVIRNPEEGDDALAHSASMSALGQPSGLTLPPITEVPENLPARWASPPPGIGETADVDITIFRRRPLPFAAGAPPTAFFAAADAARAEVRRPGTRATGHETMALPAMGGAAPEGEGEAGERDEAKRQGASLTLEQYAAFCAELAVFPDQVASVHRRYGVADETARRALDGTFAQRFQGDPTLQRRWRALVAHYGDWYRGQVTR
jgi:hypothetical protein